MGGILRFRETVGIKEDGIIVVEGGFLSGKVHSLEDAERDVGLDRQRPDVVGQHQRRVVTGIAVGQVAVCQIQHAAEEGDEHVVVVLFRQAVVHLLHDDFGTVIMGGDGTERRARDGHHQRGRDALPAHVSDAEEQFLIPDEEVIQVPAHFLGRDDGGSHIQVAPFRIGREDVGNHGHLDVPGDPELTLDTVPFQFEFLVFVLAFDKRAENHGQHHQAQQLEQVDQPAGPADTAEDVVFRDGDAHGPACTLDRGIEDVAFLPPMVRQDLAPGFSGQHRALQFFEILVVLDLFDHLLYGLLLVQLPGVAEHVAAGPADHQVAGVGIDLDGFHQVGHPVQEEVRRQDGGRVPFLVLDGTGEGGHQYLAASRVDVRLRPILAVQFDGHTEPFLGRIVIFGRGQRDRDEFIPVAVDIGSIQRTLRIPAGNEGHGGSQDHGIVLDETLADAGDAVRIIQAPLRDPDAVPDGGFNLVDDVHDFVPGGLQLGFRPFGSFFLQPFNREIELDERRADQGDGGNKHHQQSLPEGLFEEQFIEGFLQRRVIGHK